MWHEAQEAAGSAFATMMRHRRYLSDAWHCRQVSLIDSRSLALARIVTIAAGDARRKHLALLE